MPAESEDAADPVFYRIRIISLDLELGSIFFGGRLKGSAG